MKRGGRPAAAAVVAAVFVFPLVFLVVASLRPPGEPPPTGLEVLLPRADLGSFERAFALVDLGRQLLNSGIVVLLAVPLTVVVASAAGFAAAQAGRRTRRLIVGGSLLAMVVPLQALWVPRFKLFSELGLTDSFVPLVAPALMATSPLYVLLFHWSFGRVPRDLIDAARLEGLGPVAIWRRVAAPLVRPTTFAVTVLAFAFHWGNFADALLYLNDPDLYTAPLGLRQLAALGPTDFATLTAAALVVTAPAVAVFAAAQRRMLSGLRGAVWLGR